MDRASIVLVKISLNTQLRANSLIFAATIVHTVSRNRDTTTINFGFMVAPKNLLLIGLPAAHRVTVVTVPLRLSRSGKGVGNGCSYSSGRFGGSCPGYGQRWRRILPGAGLCLRGQRACRPGRPHDSDAH